MKEVEWIWEYIIELLNLHTKSILIFILLLFPIVTYFLTNDIIMTISNLMLGFVLIKLVWRKLK